MSLRGVGWSRTRVRGGLVAGFAAVVLGVSGCSGGEQDSAGAASPSASASASVSASPSVSASASSSPSASATPSEPAVVKAKVGSYAGWNLEKAVAAARSHHAGSVSYTDASELGRSVVHTYNWKVCSQTPSAGVYDEGTKVSFKIVGVNESCARPPRASSGSASGSTTGGSSSGGGSSSAGGSGSGSGGSSSSGGGSTKTQLCSIRSNAGNCYRAGQFCRSSDVGATTTDAAGRTITCSYQSRANRWHY